MTTPWRQASQKLAVGTSKGELIVYDLRAAERWRSFDGHSGPITAVAFRPDGVMVASYGASESVVRWWQVCDAAREAWITRAGPLMSVCVGVLVCVVAGPRLQARACSGVFWAWDRGALK